MNLKGITQSKPETKDYKLHDSICTKMLKILKAGRTQGIKSISGTGMVAVSVILALWEAQIEGSLEPRT